MTTKPEDWEERSVRILRDVGVKENIPAILRIIENEVQQALTHQKIQMKEEIGNKIKHKFNSFGGTLGFTEGELMKLFNS